MEEITQDDINSQTENKPKLPPSPKRPRTDCTMSNNHSGKSRFDFSELLTFQKAFVTKSLTNKLQKNDSLECTAECEDVEDMKTEKQLQDTQPVVIPWNKLSSPHSDDANTGSSNACFIPPERSVLLVKDELPPANETDKLSSYPPDDAGGALVESHTSKDASADSSSQPDCVCLGKSLEDKPPGGCNLPAGNGRDGRQVQNSVSQIKASNLSSSDEQVRCLSDCTCEGTIRDTGFCNAYSQCTEVEEYNQSGEDGFSEDILLNENGANGPLSYDDYADTELFYSLPEEDPFENTAEGAKNEAEIIKMQHCENEHFAVCDEETKDQVNENGMSKNSIPSAAEWAEGSFVSHDMVLVRNVGTETASLEADDFCGAKGAHAACTMIAKTGSEMADHTTETPMPARISQEPAEGDNDAGPFGVIDPAILSESDGEAEEKRWSSGSAVGAELSPFVRICEGDIPLCPNVQQPQEDSASDQSRTHLCKDEEEDLCQSYTEPQARLNSTIKETKNNDKNEDSCQGKSSPSSSPCSPVKALPDKTPESSDTVGHQSTEQDQSDCFPASLDNLLTQEVEYLLDEIARRDVATKIEEKKETALDMRSDEHEKLECLIDFEEKLRGSEKYKEDTSEMSIVDFIEWAEGKIIINGGNMLTYIEEEPGNNLECLSDHPYSAVIPMMEETTEEREGEEAEDIDVNGSSEMLVKLMDGELRGDNTKASSDEYISEQTEAIMSPSGDKLILNSQQEQSIEPCLSSVYQNRPETDDLLAFTTPPSSDAVVPGPHEFRLSQIVDPNPPAFMSGDGFSVLPSALPFCARMTGAFDTFEKIELSPNDDGDNDAGLRNSPLLTSLPEQLLNTPQRQLHHPMPEAESNEHEEVPQEEDEEGKEEDEERFECHTDNMANGLSSCDYSCDELSNFISAADVPAPGWPEQKPHCESVFKSSEGFEEELKPPPVSCHVSSNIDSAASDVNNKPKFEMKKEFDKVLKELSLFFDVSRSEFACYSREASPEQCGYVTKTWESDTPDFKGPLAGCEKDTSSDDAEDVRSLDVCGGDPVVSCAPSSGDGEQEVPLGSCQDKSMFTAEKHKEPQETEPKRKTWSPSFMCQPFLEQLSYRPPEPNWRLEPLRTCSRPLRVGLSKKAKTKHLHRPHPYK
ncbi:uncharacterized protein LOC117824101 [Notolabrus celidotus]|uniref:uncharacterized protein LOC117824101 n=1 Tax=Notolabrus celidotus TaxID=1203425 RepID=UPI00148FAC87|nr:uncharacterized protein LOC117824101 [Notolabrus celidotus]